ncbi:MAG TPA: hypothetical protein VHT02_09360, partial [Methylocella sp.]|nr:hypothetical protein [Methylocella sp.]
VASKKSPSKRSHGKAQPKKVEVSGGDGEAATLGQPPRRTLLLILGMHRSGTSAYTNTFALLGAALPRSLMSGSISNEKGHFESSRLFLEHDKMLAEIGSQWYDWNALSEDFFKSTLARTFAARFAEIVREEYEDAELIVVKDPRICRFVPIWREVATLLDATIKVVSPLRNPMEVASSLKKRDNLPIQESLLVWTRHVLDAEFWTRDLPRAFIAYEALLGDWRSVVDQCSKEIEFAFPRRSPKAERQVDVYLDRGLRRNKFADNEFLGHSNIPDWTQDAYVSLRKLQTDSRNQEVLRKLDQVKADFDRVSSNLASVFAERDQRLIEATGANAQKASELEQRAATLDGALRESQTRFRDVEQQLGEALQQRSYLEDALSRAKDNAAQLEQEVRLKVDSERQLKCLLEQSNAIALKSQEHLAVEQRSSQQIFTAYAATISAIDQLKQEKTAIEVEHDARLHLRRSLAASFWRHQSNCAPTAARMNVQALEAIAESQNRLVNDIIDFCHASYIFSDRSHRDGAAGTQSAYHLLQKRFIPRILPRLERGLLATGRGQQMFAIAMSGLFDTRWYLEQNADVAQSSASPLLHFLLHGGQEGRDPSRLFSAKAYLASYPDVARARINPLVHFLFHGLSEGRDVRPHGVPDTG